MTTPQGQVPEALRPIQRYEVVDCIDSKHVPAVIPRKDGPWVRYSDHAAQVAALTQPAGPNVPGPVRLRFFRDMTEDQRLLVFKVFGVLPDGAEGEAGTHSVQWLLLQRLYKQIATHAQPSAVESNTAYAELPDANDLSGALTAAEIGINVVIRQAQSGNTGGAVEVAQKVKQAIAQAVAFSLRASHGQAPAGEQKGDE